MSHWHCLAADVLRRAVQSCPRSVSAATWLCPSWHIRPTSQCHDSPGGQHRNGRRLKVVPLTERFGALHAAPSQHSHALSHQVRFQSFRLLLRAGRLLTLVGNRQGYSWSLLSTMQASSTLAGIIQGQDTSSPASWEAPADASCAQHPSPSHLQEAAVHANPVKTRKKRTSCHHGCHVAERSHHAGRAP